MCPRKNTKMLVFTCRELEKAAALPPGTCSGSQAAGWESGRSRRSYWLEFSKRSNSSVSCRERRGSWNYRDTFSAFGVAGVVVVAVAVVVVVVATGAVVVVVVSVAEVDVVVMAVGKKSVDLVVNVLSAVGALATMRVADALASNMAMVIYMVGAMVIYMVGAMLLASCMAGLAHWPRASTWLCFMTAVISLWTEKSLSG